MARVLIAGESWQVFSIHTKGFDSFFTTDYGEGVAGFRSALESGGHVVEFQPNHVAAKQFPDTDRALSEFDVIVLSDIGSNTLLMPSETFVKAEVRPNRLVVLRDWVAGGGGLAMIGGYLSFQGIEGKANYRSTALAEVLPVELEPGDDRQEAPDGAVGRVAAAEHPITAGIGTSGLSCSAFSGSWPKRIPTSWQPSVSGRSSLSVASAKDASSPSRPTLDLIGLPGASPSGRGTHDCGARRSPGLPVAEGANVATIVRVGPRARPPIVPEVKPTSPWHPDPVRRHRSEGFKTLARHGQLLGGASHKLVRELQA